MLVIMYLLSITFGVLVIISKNPVRSVLCLIGLFLTIAVNLSMLGMSFIALAYILVYVGAVSILFLFILMLVNVRASELTTDNNNSIPLSIIVITIFSIVFSNKSLFSSNDENLALLFNINKTQSAKELFFIKDADEKIYLVFSSIWDNILENMSHIISIGNILYTTHAINIIIIGFILLLAMIGALSITITSNDQ